MASVVFSLLMASQAAAITEASVTPADDAIGATTNYTLTLRASVDLDQFGMLGADGISLTAQDSDPMTSPPNFSGASLVSVSGGTLNGSLTTTSANGFTLTVSSGSASAGTLISIVVSGVVNPGVTMGEAYTVRTFESSVLPPVVDEFPVAGNTFTSSNLPVVVDPIDDLLGGNGLFVGDGAMVVVNDLDDVFEDADMDPLTFSVVAGHDTSVATVSINGADALTVTPVGSGTTDITIRADSVDGFATDTFSVQVIGELSNAVATPQNTDAMATTSYDFSFDAASLVDSNRIITIVTGAGGPDYSSAGVTFGGGLTGSVGLATDQSILLDITAGSVSAGGAVVFSLTNVVNPGASGQGPDYDIRVRDTLSNEIDRGVAPGNVFGAVNVPTVVSPIPDQNLNEIDGAQVIEADLNNVFDEADMEVLSFSLDPGNDPLVATASILNDALTVTPVGPGSTDISVRATDSDGSAVDTFTVNVVGIMDNASWIPDSFDTEATTTYTLAFTTSSELAAGRVLIVENLNSGGPNYAGASLGSINVALSVTPGFSANTVTVTVDSGTVPAGTPVSVTINAVTNPSVGGLGPDYQTRVFQSAPPTGDVERAVLPGTDFIDVGIPMVVNPIGNRTINQADGPNLLIPDLNSVFTDGNGQALTFSVLPGNDTSIATGQVNASALTISPVAPGQTSFMIAASDLPAGGTGTAVDQFDLTVLGALTGAVVTPASLEISTVTDYQTSFAPAATLSSGDTIILSTTNGGPDLSAANLTGLSGGTLTGFLLAQSATSVTLQVSGGMAMMGETISFGLNPVTNPGRRGLGPDYRIEVRDAGGLRSFGTAPGNDYFDPDSIFFDGLE